MPEYRCTAIQEPSMSTPLASALVIGTEAGACPCAAYRERGFAGSASTVCVAGLSTSLRALAVAA